VENPTEIAHLQQNYDKDFHILRPIKKRDGEKRQFYVIIHTLSNVFLSNRKSRPITELHSPVNKYVIFDKRRFGRLQLQSTDSDEVTFLPR
jgi:hypothetical protein